MSPIPPARRFSTLAFCRESGHDYWTIFVAPLSVIKLYLPHECENTVVITFKRGEV